MLGVDENRQGLRRTFDQIADRYQDARPEYPESLLTLVEKSGLRSGDRLLEVGSGSGKATLPLARRGYRIACVELGPALAAAAQPTLPPSPAWR